MSLFRDFLELFYPSLCISCQQRLVEQETFLCTDCLYSLPQTNHVKNKTNQLSKMFYGRLPLESIGAFAYFSKGNCIQKIIHEIKYKQNKKLGFYIGKLCGNELYNSRFIEGIDCIVPVPLHPNRLKSRGYNQSLLIAAAISQKTGIPIIENNLVRIIDNTTQTNKSKAERWYNATNIFTVKNKAVFENKHILLIDDVITTGSTIEVCAKKIISCKNTKISIYCFGLAV